MTNSTKIVLLLFLLSCFGNISAQVTLPKIIFTQVFTGLESPVSLASCNDDRIFIVEKEGVIRIGYPNGTVRDTPFLDIKDRVKSGGERGLLGLAFPPNFKQSGLFYVNYTGEDEGQTVISRFRVSSDSNFAIKQLEEVLLEVDQPFSNHNGGNIEFGNDGYLYIGMGDGGSGGDPFNNSQNKETLLGKMLRIDVDHIQGYTIPADNPFVNDDEYLPEIWAMGMRNPWRFKFDERNGDLWIADVGQGEWEEVDYEPAGSGGGKNYGWRCYEGYEPYNTAGCLGESNYTFPVAAFGHNEGHCSITGGVVDIKDPNSSLFGYYLSTDYCSGQFWGSKKNADNSFTTIELAKPNFANCVAFGYDLQKNMYVARDNGTIYRIDTFVLCTSNLAITGEDDHIGCDTETVALFAPTFENGEYTWFFEGEEISNSDTDTLIVTQSGDYSVQFISEECSAVSLQPYTIIHNEDIVVELLDLQEEYCVNGAPLVLHGQPEGGVFIGTGIIDSLFYPEISNVGTFTITYFYENEEGCSGFDVKTIKVLRAPEADILSAPPNQCLQGPPLELMATPVEGFFSGDGISGNTFYPSVAGLGTHKIYYTNNPVPGCYAYDSIFIKVIDCSVSTKDLAESQYSIYPNPVGDDIYIKCLAKNEHPASVKIMDQLGRVVYNKDLTTVKFDNDQYRISTINLIPGTYILILTDNKEQFSKKLIKL